MAASVGAFMPQPLSIRVRSQTTGGLASTKQARNSGLKMADDQGLGLAAAESKDLDLLGLPARPGRSLKVAIAGGGVGGLTAALCMLKKGFDVTVYEKTSAFAR